MVAADLTDFLEEARRSGRPYTVLAVTLALFGSIEPETNRITATQRQIARKACVDVSEVNRALDALVEMGALIREARGKYRFYPDFIWRGSLAGRTNTLRLIEGGRASKRA